MPDYIKGPVIEIVDEETIIVEVAFVGKSNKKEYHSVERVHINTLEPPFLKGIPIEKQKPRLEKKLLNPTCSPKTVLN